MRLPESCFLVFAFLGTMERALATAQEQPSNQPWNRRSHLALLRVASVRRFFLPRLLCQPLNRPRLQNSHVRLRLLRRLLSHLSAVPRPLQAHSTRMCCFSEIHSSSYGCVLNQVNQLTHRLTHLFVGIHTHILR